MAKEQKGTKGKLFVCRRNKAHCINYYTAITYSLIHTIYVVKQLAIASSATYIRQ